MRSVTVTVLLLLATAAALPAQNGTGPASPSIQVAEAVVATGVENREPVGVAADFPETVGTVYFYTALQGDFGSTRVEHVWLRDGEEVARVPLDVRGPRWRTWTSKRIPPEHAGPWTVRVEGSDGTVLRSVEFTVGEQR